MSVGESTGSFAQENGSDPGAETAPIPAGGGFRILLAERRANAHSELSRRLARLGHEVLARVTSAQAALDYAGLLRPDVVLVAPVLEDTSGVLAALNVTRELPGIAAVVLTCHPAAADPAARPNWGAVALVPADAESDDLDAEMRRAVSRARAEALLNASPEGPVAVPSAAREAAAPAEVTHDADPWVPSPYQVPESSTVPESSAAPESSATKQVDGSLTALVQSLWPESAESEANQNGATAVLDSNGTTGSEAANTAANTGSPVAEPESDVAAAAAATSSSEEEGYTAGYSGEDEVIRAAADALVVRVGITRADAMRLMEQEATDLNQSMEDVARAVLGEPVGGGEMATVA
jgi:DNA-binding NarL/FixJ family response regulator